MPMPIANAKCQQKMRSLPAAEKSIFATEKKREIRARVGVTCLMCVVLGNVSNQSNTNNEDRRR